MRILNYDDGNGEGSEQRDLLSFQKATSVDALLFLGFLIMIEVVSSKVVLFGSETLSESVYAGVLLIPVVFEVGDGRTVGMMIYKLRIHNGKGELAGWMRLSARSAVKNMIYIIQAFTHMIEAGVLGSFFKYPYSRIEFESRCLLPVLMVCVMVNVAGLFLVNEGKRTFHDWLCGTQMAKARGV